MFCHIDVAKLLINAGANVNDLDPDTGYGALHNACAKVHKKSTDLIEVLLNAGADPFLAAKSGERPVEIKKNSEVKTILYGKMLEIKADHEFLDGGLEF